MSEPLIIAAPAERGSDTIAEKSVRATWAISGGLHLTQTTIQETPFAVIRDKTQGPAIASGSLFAGTQAAQEIRTRGMQQMVVLQITDGQRINDPKTGFRAVHHGHSDGSVPVAMIEFHQ